MRQTKAHYLETWRRILIDDMRWSQARFDEWLHRTQLAELLDDPEDMIYHEPPQLCLVDALIPKPLKGRLSRPELRGLRYSLTRLLASLDEPRPALRKGLLREEVSVLLAPYQTANIVISGPRKRFDVPVGGHKVKGRANWRYKGGTTATQQTSTALLDPKRRPAHA